MVKSEHFCGLARVYGASGVWNIENFQFPSIIPYESKIYGIFYPRINYPSECKINSEIALKAVVG